MEEKLRILKMVEDGTVTAEQGSKLMEALETEAPAQQGALVKRGYDAKMFRVIVDSPEGDKVRIQFPVGAIKKILRATGKLPIPEKDLQGVDLSDMMEAVSECLSEEIEGDLVSVEGFDGATVRIFVDQ